MPSSTLDPRLATLLGRVWPRLPVGTAHAEALGFAWTDVSTPFVRREGERVVAHVGVIELPLVIAGRRVRVGSIHAVCTDPERRRRGLARALMQETLAACAGRFETLVLTTMIPEFYTAFGFRPVREHAFTRALPPAARRPSPGGRVLTEGPDDLRLLRRLLADRAPVRYHAALDVLTVHEVRERTLVLYDVVGAMIPSLEALAAAIGADADRVVTFFAPEGLGEGWKAEPWDEARAAAHGDAGFVGLMARGPLAVDGEFMLPPLSRT